MDPTRLAPESIDGQKKRAAIQDAKDMQQAVIRNCARANCKVPPFEFIELIGKGGSGRVYKCRDTNNDEFVAVKIVDTDTVDYGQHTLDKDDTIKDFLKEVNTLKSLKDARAKNINMIKEAFDLQEQLWIVCEYCTGGSVRTLMRASPPSRPGLEEEYIIAVARELAIAIKNVHDIGVIHRDIKCTNVYVTENGEIQLGGLRNCRCPGRRGCKAPDHHRHTALHATGDVTTRPRYPWKSSSRSVWPRSGYLVVRLQCLRDGDGRTTKLR